MRPEIPALMPPRLSICIPTCNRQEWLARAMESIRIPPELQDRIEIVISDNASEDGTQPYVAELSRQFPNIRYERQPRNMGFDENIVHVLSQARGEYCWLFGDDDRMNPEAVQTVWDDLRENPDILLMNRINCDDAQVPRRKQYWLDNAQPGFFDLNKEAELLGYLSSARSLGALFSFISCVVVRKSRLRLDDIPPARLLTGYIHVYLFLRDIVGTGSRLQYEPACLVLCRWPAVTTTRVSLDRFRQDVDCFCSFVDEIFEDRPQVRQAMVSVLRREHPVKKMIFLYSQHPREQADLAVLALRIGYSRQVNGMACRIGNLWVMRFILGNFYGLLRRLIRGV